MDWKNAVRTGNSEMLSTNVIDVVEKQDTVDYPNSVEGILNEKQREFPGPPGPGVKRVRSAAQSIFQVTVEPFSIYGSHVIRLAKHPSGLRRAVSGLGEGADLHGHQQRAGDNGGTPLSR